MTPDQGMLLGKAYRSLDTAKVLLERGDYDFAASRAYYTMFYMAEALLHGMGKSFSKHSAVNAAFGQHFAKTGLLDPRFHRYLIEGENIRTKADYDAELTVTDEEARREIAHAEEFLAAAERYLREAG